MFMEVPEELNKEIRSLDEIFDICTLDDYFHGDPEVSDMERVLSMCERVEELFDQEKIRSFKDSLIEDLG
jgi:hypothetical protein